MNAEVQQCREGKRVWVRPEVTEYASLTALTQYSPPGAFAMLFQAGSDLRCFDGFGNPVPCP
jgi:hypothetical protein